MPISPGRARLLVLFVAVAAFLNSLGNGFAFDDNWFIVENDVVTEQEYGRAFTESSWPGAFDGAGNYRPLVLASFAAEWSLWGPSPLGFHIVSVIAHAAVSLLVLALLSVFATPLGALVGAMLFAVHPVHVEAVANVMGRSELYAALAYLSACLVYLKWRPTRDRAREARLLVLCGLFLMGVGSKEIAVTLPAVLMLLEAVRSSSTPLKQRWTRESATYLALFGLLGIFVIVRWIVLGMATGANTTPGMQNADTLTRILTAVSVWPEYVRLMVFPLDLVADYAPAVLLFTDSITPEVVVGAMVLLGLAGLAWAFRSLSPATTLGLAWFLITVSPVSNLLVRSDVLLAERTLYLPSVGFAVLVAVAVDGANRSPRPLARPLAMGLVGLMGLGFFIRTVDRNPTWVDTFSVMRTLAEEHPESWRSQWAIASGQVRVGDTESATETYGIALQLAPDHYQLLVEVALYEAGHGRIANSEALFERAINVLPDFAGAYRRQAEERIRRGDYRGGHEVVTRGLREAGADRELFALLSETYIARSDLEGALRARMGAIGQEPDSAHDWGRLADIRAAQGELVLAGDARRRADELRAAGS